jgi:hypothetical protein
VFSYVMTALEDLCFMKLGLEEACSLFLFYEPWRVGVELSWVWGTRPGSGLG